MFYKISGVCFILFGILSLCYLSFELGQKKAHVKVITQQIEVIKYVEKKKATIYSQPNATKAELLTLMRQNIL